MKQLMLIILLLGTPCLLIAEDLMPQEERWALEFVGTEMESKGSWARAELVTEHKFSKKLSVVFGLGTSIKFTIHRGLISTPSISTRKEDIYTSFSLDAKQYLWNQAFFIKEGFNISFNACSGIFTPRISLGFDIPISRDRSGFVIAYQMGYMLPFTQFETNHAFSNEVVFGYRYNL